ncbi:helix-turn-helix transcriptional regulator [Vibrio cholerae]|nr:helix-turn-helix transcriptional regulator [Vibrio cholerae]
MLALNTHHRFLISMIERGKRVPSVEMLEVIAKVFQKIPSGFR